MESYNPVGLRRTGFLYGADGNAPATSTVAPRLSDAELPEIAIGLLSYNRAADVIESLDIFLRIDYPTEKVRLIVIDNASTDGTKEQIEERYGARVEVMRQPVNYGAVARNRVILTCPEPYIFIFDEDCATERPDTIRRIVEYMEANSYFGALCLRSINFYSRMTEYDNWGDVARRLYNGAYEGVFVAGNGMCFRRDAIQRTAGYDERWQWGSEEFCLALEILYHDMPIAYVPDFALVHRRAQRAYPPARVLELEARNNIWTPIKYLPLPVAALVAVAHTVHRYITALRKGGPDGQRAVLRGTWRAIKGLPEIYAHRKLIPVSRLAQHNRWFIDMLLH